jgi:hypothetical protein
MMQPLTARVEHRGWRHMAATPLEPAAAADAAANDPARRGRRHAIRTVGVAAASS